MDDDQPGGQGTSRREFARLLAFGGSAALLARPSLASEIPPLPKTPAVPDEAYWAAVKAQFALPPEVASLNAANLCPSPIPVIEAVVNRTDLDHDLSPANRTRMHEAKETTRALLAEFLRVTADEILITRNTSESNNLVSSGLDFKAGDEVVVFSDNHKSNDEAWREKGKRWGYAVRVVEQVSPHPGPEFYLKAFAAQMTPRTRLVALTHVTNTVGDLLPVRELCRMAREHGALSLVDGAQTFGAMDLDLAQMGADFYSGSAHKWVCGPKETGLLFVRKEVQPRLWPSVISLYQGAVGISKTFEGLGQRDEPALIGFGEALRFQNRVGRGLIEKRSRELALHLIEGLGKIDGVKVWTHADRERSHAVVSFQPGSLDPLKLQGALYKRDHVVSATRAGSDRGGLRLAPHFYNLHAEVDRTVAAIRGYMSRGL